MPQLRAYLILLHRVAIQVRFCSMGQTRLPDRQLHDLMDAIHNITSLLADYGHYESEASIRASLQRYDDRWTEKDPYHFSLIRVLNSAFDEVGSHNPAGQSDG